MAEKKLRLEADQRLDLDDLQFLIDQGDVRLNEVMRSLFAKEATRGYILRGFEFEGVAASLDIRLKDLESIAVDSDGHILYRPVSGSTVDYSVSSFAPATNIYLHLDEKEIASDTASRRKWDVGSNAEILFSPFTRNLRSFGVYMTTGGFVDSADPSDVDDPGTHKMIQVGVLTHDGSEVDSWIPTPTEDRILLWESKHSQNEVGNRLYWKPGTIEFAGTINGALGASSGTVPVNENIAGYPDAGTLLVGHGATNGVNDQEILEYTSHDGGSPGTFTLAGTTANAHASGQPVSILSPAGFEFSVNASFDGTNWVKDIDDMISSKFQFSGDKITWASRDASNNADWLDSAWDNQNGGFDLTTYLWESLKTSGVLEVEGTSALKDQATLGENIVGNDVNAELETPRIKADYDSNTVGKKTLIWEAQPNPSGTFKSPLRMYLRNDIATGGPDFELVFNAVYSNGTSLWSQDSTTEARYRIRWWTGGASLFLERQSAGAGTWGDGAWTNAIEFRAANNPNRISLQDDGEFRFTNTGTNSNPSATTAHSNILVAKNLVKAWANITMPVNPSATTVPLTTFPNVTDGFNITGGAYELSDTQAKMTIATAMDNANFAVVCGNGLATRIMKVTAFSTTQFTIRAADSSGTFQAIDVNNDDFMVVILARDSS